MNKKILKIATLCLLLLQMPLTSAATPLVDQTQTKINKILHSYGPNINVGIMVQSLATGEIIYQKNADQLFMPASVLKIFPAVAALSFFGPDYFFTTKVIVKNVVVNNGILDGDLYFYFDGDPSLTRQDLYNLVTKITECGIHTINGDIYIDDTIFDQETSGPGWMWDECNLCYAAPTSAITIDKNCFPLELSSANKPDQRTFLSLNDYEKFVSVMNQVTSRNSINNDDCQLNLHNTRDNFYYITGCMAPNTKQNLLVAIHDVRLYAKNILLEQLRAHNIKLLGEIKFKNIPTDTQTYTLAEHRSEPLSVLLKTMLKKSDNLIADAVYKKIGYGFFHKTSSWRSSERAIASILAPKTNIAFNKQIRLVDGSGLSRYNLISSSQLVAVLRYAYNDKEINQTFINALSKAGVDGTLKYRMPNLIGRVYAKTGNMDGISSLVGYIKTINYGNIAFAITINSFLDNHQKYRQLQDRICEVLAQM